MKGASHYRLAKSEMHQVIQEWIRNSMKGGWKNHNLSDSRSWSKVASFTSGISPFTRGVCWQNIKSMIIHMA
jgi:hypothetical protein